MPRVLVADEDQAALIATAARLRELGHDVIDAATEVSEVGDRVAADDPDVAIVVVHRDVDHALALIEEIAAYANGPVIALGQEGDEGFVEAAADRGIMAYASGQDDLQQAIDVALRRHAELRELGEQVMRLEGALERRAVIERAKGVLMERHAVDDRAAFELLRAHARNRGRRVLDVAAAVLEGHALLPGAREA